MVDRLKKIPTQLLEAWNNYTNKQKTLIISVVAAVFFAIVLLTYIVSRPQMEELVKCETTSDASEITELLKGDAINYTLSNDSKTIYVDKKVYSDALLLLGKNNIPKSSMSLSDAFSSSFSTTESEKTKRWLLYQQDEIRIMLLAINGIKDAVVNISQGSTDNTILAEKQDTSASVLLTVTDEFSTTTPETIANLIAMKLGNESTDKIRIADQNGSLLFSGNTDLQSGGSVNSIYDFKSKITSGIENDITRLLIKSKEYDDADVVANLTFDLNKVNELYTQYTPADDQEQGLLDNSYTYNSNGVNSSGGVPGTDSNGDDTEYMTQDNANSNSTVEIEKNQYIPNKKETQTQYEVGTLLKNESSLSIVLTSYKIYREEDLELQGILADTTFEEYVLTQAEQVKLEIDPEIYNAVSKATGIAEGDISIIAWEQPIFQPKATTATNWALYMQIALVVLIIALLIFVVFKGTAPVEVTELEPELSVEQLLATTKENQSLDDIDFDDKSETRKMIEKFVDENPEAVANLLRNWLSDDWG